MRKKAVLATALLAGLVFAAPSGAVTPAQFDAVVAQMQAANYQPNYVPTGLDHAFDPDLVPNTAPAQDYTSGSIPGDPDHPSWPAAFTYVRYFSADGAPLRARLALHPGSHPGIVVVHGFNTNGKESVIRWAAMLYKNGYNVIASDQRDYKDEYQPSMAPLASDGYPNWLQTFGWKESQDVVAAGNYLKSQAGVTSVGVVGFSEGAQNTVLALAQDAAHVFSAGLTFSAPADQNWQVYSTASPSGCVPPACSYPATDALIALVVPPYGSGGKYDDPCQVLNDAATKYGTSPASILGQEKAYHAQQSITVPLLNYYSADDSLVDKFQATMMAGYENGHPLQRTILVQSGEHAYFFDRHWQQQAILFYFKGMLGDPAVGDLPTVDVPTPAGSPMSAQSGVVTASQADAESQPAPLICPGGPTAAAFTSLRATRAGHAVLLRWRTAGEVGTLGFRVLREEYGRRVELGRALIPARGGTSGASYSFRDRLPAATRTRYFVQEVRLDGSRTLHGPVVARR